MQTIYAIDHLAKTQKWQTAIMQRKTVKEIVCQAQPSKERLDSIPFQTLNRPNYKVPFFVGKRQWYTRSRNFRPKLKVFSFRLSAAESKG